MPVEAQQEAYLTREGGDGSLESKSRSLKETGVSLDQEREGLEMLERRMCSLAGQVLRGVKESESRKIRPKRNQLGI